MRYFSTFSGIGGFEIGINNAYMVRHEAEQTARTPNQHMPDTSSKDGSWRQQCPTCVGYSEIDKYAIKVYEKHYPGVKNYGDITKINADELPDFDCLVGGFPCQAFSIAGKRKGFDDTRGTLFFDLARILRAKQPRLFVFENVKGLLSHDNGRTFATIISTLTDLGYDCQWQVLNSKNHGVPQNRERVIIVGHSRGTPRPKVFPITENGGLPIKRQRQVSPTITQRYHKQGQSDPYIVSEEAESGEPSLSQDGNQPDDSHIRGGQTHPSVPRIRRLTPLECERLQGFPDGWTALGIGDEPISDTQRYKMCGNAVTTNVVQAVFERILGKVVV